MTTSRLSVFSGTAVQNDVPVRYWLSAYLQVARVDRNTRSAHLGYGATSDI